MHDGTRGGKLIRFNRWFTGKRIWWAKKYSIAHPPLPLSQSLSLSACLPPSLSLWDVQAYFVFFHLNNCSLKTAVVYEVIPLRKQWIGNEKGVYHTRSRHNAIARLTDNVFFWKSSRTNGVRPIVRKLLCLLWNGSLFRLLYLLLYWKKFQTYL